MKFENNNKEIIRKITKRSLKTNTPPQQILLEEGLFTAEELANLMTPKEMIRV